MSNPATLSAIAKSVGKRPVTQLEAVRVAYMKPSDIGKAIRVKVYHKWTVIPTTGAKQPVLCFILLDQQV